MAAAPHKNLEGDRHNSLMCARGGGRYRRYQGARGDDACAFQEAGGQWAMEGWGFSQILGFGGWIDPVTERPGAGKT